VKPGSTPAATRPVRGGGWTKRRKSEEKLCFALQDGRRQLLNQERSGYCTFTRPEPDRS